jgi:hypothetical protein
VNLENPDGSQVRIEVIPAEKTKQDLTNEIVVITQHPYLRTEQEARLRWQELCRSLNQYDLQVSRPEVLSPSPLMTVETVENPSALTEPLLLSKRQDNV